MSISKTSSTDEVAQYLNQMESGGQHSTGASGRERKLAIDETNISRRREVIYQAPENLNDLLVRLGESENSQPMVIRQESSSKSLQDDMLDLADDITDEDIQAALQGIDDDDEADLTGTSLAHSKRDEVQQPSQQKDIDPKQDMQDHSDVVNTERFDKLNHNDREHSFSVVDSNGLNRPSITDEEQFLSFNETCVPGDDVNTKSDELETQTSVHASNTSKTDEANALQTDNSGDASSDVLVKIENATQQISSVDEPTHQVSEQHVQELAPPSSQPETSQDVKVDMPPDAPAKAPESLKKPSDAIREQAKVEAGVKIANKIEDLATQKSGGNVELLWTELGPFLDGSKGMSWRPIIKTTDQPNEIVRSNPGGKSMTMQFGVNDKGDLSCTVKNDKVNLAQRGLIYAATLGAMQAKNVKIGIEVSIEFTKKGLKHVFGRESNLKDKQFSQLKLQSVAVTDTGLVLTRK